MSNTNTPHPNAEVIKAWADGNMIQFNSGFGWYDFILGDGSPSPWYESSIEWRVKPESRLEDVS